MWLLLTETVSIGSTGSLGIVPCFISPQTIDANASYSSVPQGRLELTISCHELSLHVGLDVAVEAISRLVCMSLLQKLMFLKTYYPIIERNPLSDCVKFSPHIIS